MFFLKQLPSRQMVESFLEIHPGAQPDNIQNALKMMRRASVLVRRIDHYFAEHDLSQLRFLILIVISREPDRNSLKIHEIIDRIDVSKPVMTRTLNALAVEGLVQIDDDPTDKRSKTVSLTAQGQQKLSRLLPGYFALLNGYMETFDDENDD